MTRPSDKVFCCRWVRNRVPVTHRDELFHILRMTGPLLFSRIFNYLLPFVVTMFCGRLGNNVMAGYGLATAVINVSTVATGTGLARTCDTLVSQTFGGRNHLRVGVILQRSIIILLLFCLPCWGLLINARPILLCLGQDPEVARIAQLYINAYLPAVPAVFLHHLQVSYLQNQGIILPQLYTAVLANVANVLTNYIFLYCLDLGVYGSAAANALAWIYICVFLFVYIWVKRLYVTTWAGWSRESLQEWGSFTRLAIPSSMMTCFEWWLYECGGFFAGMISEADLAAQHAVMMISFITYMFPLGVQAAACARVGNALGAGDTDRAFLITKLSIGLACSFSVCEGILLGCSKTVIGYIFTSDEEIVGLVSKLMELYCVVQLGDGLVCVTSGIFLGTGKQKIPAVANFVGYYCIGLPLAVVLIFVAKLKTFGFWLGLLIAVIIQSSFYVILILFKLNWKQVTEEAVKRAHKKTNLTLLNNDRPADAQEDPFDGHTSADGYTSVCSDGTSEPRGGDAAPQKRLSTVQLIVRRGITTCAAVALMVAGICVHFTVPLPEVTDLSTNVTMDHNNGSFTPDQILSTVLVPVNAA